MSTEARVRTGHTQAPSEGLGSTRGAEPTVQPGRKERGRSLGQRRVNSCGVSIRASEEEKDLDQERWRGAGQGE